MAGPPPTLGTARQRAERLAAALPPLLIEAERVAATVAQGVHGRRRVGQGDTFWQFRRYEPGNPAQRIDWRRSAKSDALFIRETEWEAAASVWLWCDLSPSMAYRSAASLPEKADRAAVLLLALASLLLRGDEHVALLGSGMQPRAGSSTLDRIAFHVDRLRGEPAANPGLPAFAPLPRHAQLVLLGDFLAPLPQIDEMVRRYADAGVRGHLVQILDPAEESLPFAGRTRFEGLEGEGEVLIRRVEAVRKDYMDRMERHRSGLAAIARAIGWDCLPHLTDRPPETALLALYGRLTAGRDRF